jgi:ribosomal protein S18 acetylase RimI-like enzyme
MAITFIPLHTSYFPVLLKWLETPHVKNWWDQDVSYTMALIHEKYGAYSKGYKLIAGIQKPIQSFIIHHNHIPVGYIQMYNAYDFHVSDALSGLPKNLGAIDMFIGEATYLRQNIGSSAIQLFLEQHLYPRYQYALVVPDYANEIAIKTYEKAGFTILKRVDKIFWMVNCKKIVRLSVRDSIALDVAFRRSFLEKDGLWMFGSRADLNRRGGDIDVYIETNAASIDEAIHRKSQFIHLLEQAIGEQKIDVVLNIKNFPHPIPIHYIAKTEGIKVI